MDTKAKTLALALFGWLAIGAKDCTGWGWGSSGYEGYTAGVGGGSTAPSCGLGGMEASPGAGGASVGSGAGGGYLGAGGGPGLKPQSSGSGACPESGNVISYFRSSDFLPFVTIVPDDGQGSGGGWQQWSGWLGLADGVTNVYSCHATIGMPVRASGIGVITSFVAAHYSAEIANEAAGGLWPTPYPQGIFCDNFITLMQALFKKNLLVLGARVTS